MCVHVQVRGRVQGVGFRWACVQHALALGLAGWVRNRTDGSVEAVLQGPAATVRQMCLWLHDGVPGARVESLHVEERGGGEVHAGFEQRPTA